jgi:hypothetical protein
MKERVLIVNQNAGYLTIDVVNAFALEYDEVVVMYGRIKVTERTFHSKVKIQKTIAYNRNSTFSRLITWTLSSIHLFFLVAFRYRKFKILYYTNPPMSYFVSLFFKNPFGIIVFDTYPDALKVIGVKSSNLIYRYWANVNKRVFPKAEKIITLSNGMKQQLLSYVADEKIEVVPMWPASEKFKPIKKSENPFLVQHDWLNKFVILYSGNMGLGHQIEILIEVAERVKQDARILFLFIGEGSKKKSLQELSLAKGLNNIQFLTWQTPEVMTYSLASADIAVVAVEPDAANASVPSKTFNYMAVGAPLLCIGSKDSELEHLVLKNENGRFFTCNDVLEITNYVKLLCENSELKDFYSQNSCIAAQKVTFALAKKYLFK